MYTGMSVTYVGIRWICSLKDMSNHELQHICQSLSDMLSYVRYLRYLRGLMSQMRGRQWEMESAGEEQAVWRGWVRG